MYKSIYQNSYVVAITLFIILYIVFYLFHIGYETEIVNIVNNNNQLVQNKVIKKFSWKYPAAIALITWLVWHFILYPQKELPQTIHVKEINKKDIKSLDNIGKYSKIMNQKIIMQDWI